MATAPRKWASRRPAPVWLARRTPPPSSARAHCAGTLHEFVRLVSVRGAVAAEVPTSTAPTLRVRQEFEQYLLRDRGLKAWKFGAKTEALDAEQRRLFEETLAEDEASPRAQLGGAAKRQGRSRSGGRLCRDRTMC